MSEVGAKLAEVTGAQGISFGYLLDTAQAWRLFWGLFRQTGGEFEIEVGTPAMLDIDAAATVIRAVNSWMDGTVMPADQDYDGALASFNSGRTGMILSGEWELIGFQAAKGADLVDGMPMPTMFGTPANYADSHSYVFPARREISEGQLERTYQLVVGILGEGGQWASAGHVPAYLPAQQTEEYAQLEVQQHYPQAAEVAVFDPPTWFAGAGTDFQNRMSQVLIEGLRGSLEPERAAERLVAELESQLTSPDPTA